MLVIPVHTRKGLGMEFATSVSHSELQFLMLWRESTSYTESPEQIVRWELLLSWCGINSHHIPCAPPALLPHLLPSSNSLFCCAQRSQAGIEIRNRWGKESIYHRGDRKRGALNKSVPWCSSLNGSANSYSRWRTGSDHHQEKQI